MDLFLILDIPMDIWDRIAKKNRGFTDNQILPALKDPKGTAIIGEALKKRVKYSWCAKLIGFLCWSADLLL